MPKTYDRQTAVFLAKVAECMPELPNSVMQGLMENPQMLKRTLALLYPWMGQVVLRFRCAVWQHLEARKLSRFLGTQSDFVMGPWGRRLFEAAFIEVPEYDGECLTVRLTLRQLGFTEQVTLRDFKKRALQFGLTECPLFVAYHYRLRYTDQPLNETLYILTRSVDIGNGECSLFGLSRQGTNHPGKSSLWLDGHYGQDDFLWDPDSECVFALKQ